MKEINILSGCLTVLAFLLGCNMHGIAENTPRQASLLTLPEYPFIKYEKNILQFPASHEDFDTLYRKMDSLLIAGNGKINILHIGGSHVQAGFLSHRMRTNLASLSDSVMTQRGIIFPFRILRTNAPQNYNCHYTGTWDTSRCIRPNGTDYLGLTGASATTGDSAASIQFRLNLYDSASWNFTRLRILGYATDTLSYPYAIHNGDTLRPYLLPEERSYIIEYPESCDTAYIRFHLPSNGRFTLTGIIPENDRNGLVYHAAGINGADVTAWLNCAHLPQDLRLIRPDLAIFGIGINDANVPPQSFNPEQFKARYRKLISLFKEANPHCALLFITNNDCLLNLGRRYGKRTNPNTPKVVKAFNELAAEHNGAVWDLYHIMGGGRSSALWRNQKLMRPDRIHFTSKGYHLVGDMLYNAIITDYTQSNGN